MRLRPRLSPVMDRFIAGQFFGPFLVCLAAFTAAYLLGDMFDRFDDLIRYGGLGLLGLEYFALKLPLIISQVLPVACLAGVLLGFALLGVSLGLKPARGGHSERFGVSVALFFLYYSLMRVGETLAQRGKLNAYAAMSIPDLVFMALAFWFFYRAASDKADQGRGPGDIIWDLVERYERSRQAA